MLDVDEVLELADPLVQQPTLVGDSTSVNQTIHERLRNLGSAYGDAVYVMWLHLYAGGPSPTGALDTHAAEQTWRAWFEDEGLAPDRLVGTRYERSTLPTDGRPALEAPTEPVARSEQPTPIDQAWADVQARQQALVEAWRAQQIAELRALWSEGYHEGGANFAEQYPELATDDLMSELDAEESDSEGAMGPHLASVGKMVGELTNLLMLAPLPQQIAEWFDQNEQRVQQQAETLAWQAEQHGYREAGANFGLEIEWECENDESSCDDCIGLGDNGPYTTEDGDNPLPSFPGDGSTQCGPNCRCSLNYVEPDAADLAEAPAPGDETDAGSFIDLGSLASAMGVDQVAELEGVSLADTVDELATRSRNLNVETAFALDKDGRIIVAALGDEDSIGFSQAQVDQQRGARLVIHNHPSSTSFSPTDVAFAFSNGVREMRVVSPQWDYALKPAGQKFFPGDAAKVLDAAQAKVEKLYPEVRARAVARYQAQFAAAGPHLSWTEVFTQESANFWHDVWTATAKETGLFTYERTAAKTLPQMVKVVPVHLDKPALLAPTVPVPHDDWLAELRARYPTVDLELSRRDLDGSKDLWTLSKIVVPKAERESGTGSAIIREITQRADQLGATVALTPANTWGGSVGRLRAFYARFGFVRNTGPKRDLRISEAMFRRPSKTITFPSLEESKLSSVGQMPLDFPKTEQDLLAMQKVPGPSGANQGWWLKDAKGHSYYVKPMDSAHAANEVGAMRAYELAGAIPGEDIPYVTIIKRVDDKPVVVSRQVEGVVGHSASWWEGATGITASIDAERLWAMDALLSHFDVVGANPAKGFDNLLARAMNMKAFRVEGGGAMQFSGLGVQKGAWKVGSPWVEPWTMRGLAHGGVPGGATVKPVFGHISDAKAAQLLGQLKTLDVDALAKAWSELGMNASDIIENLAVINSRLKQIDGVQAELGFKAAAAVTQAVAPAPAPAIASKVVYSSWKPSVDKYGKALAVQLKPFFEDFKQFQPVAGKVSAIVETLSEGIDLPAFAIKQGPAKVARMKLRVAFGRSYNLALAGKFEQLDPKVAAFWKTKLGTVSVKSVDVQHVVDNWIAKKEPESVVVHTALPSWDPAIDPTASSFAFDQHPQWWIGYSNAVIQTQEAWPELAKILSVAQGSVPAGDYMKAFATSLTLYKVGPDWLKEHAPYSYKFWKQTLGDLPAQPEKLVFIPKEEATSSAIKAAVAGPYDGKLEAAKEAISVGKDAEETLADLGEVLFSGGAQAEPNDVIAGLLKFGLVGNEESAANLVADWMSKWEVPEASVKASPIGKIDGKWTTPSQGAWADFKQAVPGTYPSIGEFEATYADWLAGGDQASWMPTPVTKWFDANMAKPGSSAIAPPSSAWLKAENSQLSFLGSGTTPSGIADMWAKYQAGELTPGGSWHDAFKHWEQEVANVHVMTVAPEPGGPTKEWVKEKFPALYQDAKTQTDINDLWIAYKDDSLVGSPWEEAFKSWDALNAPISSWTDVLHKAIAQYAGGSGVEWLEGLGFDASMDVLYAKWASGEPTSYAVKEFFTANQEAIKAAGLLDAVGVPKFEPLTDLKAAWKAKFGTAPFDVWYKAWTEGATDALDLDGPIKPDSPAAKFFAQHGIPQYVEPPNVAQPVEIFGEKWTKYISDDDEYIATPMWQHIYQGGPLPVPKHGEIDETTVQSWKTWFEDKGLTPADVAPVSPAIAPTIEKIDQTKLDQLFGLLKADWPGVSASMSMDDFKVFLSQYQAGKTTEAWTAWFEAHAPEIKVSGQESTAAQSATTFTKSTTLVAWSPTNDKWAKKFGKAHPKLYGSFSKAFKTKAWVNELTKDLQFPAYAQKNTIKLNRLRLKVALARTYNLAVQGKYAELAAIDPHLPTFWKAKLGDVSTTAKAVAPINADVSNLIRVKEELRVTQPAWYADFRSAFGHTATMKIVPELANVELPIAASSTRERELRALAFAKSYLMAKAGDVEGLRKVDESLLYFWDEKLGGGLAPKVAISLEGAPWVHDFNAMYPQKHNVSAVDAKYARTERRAEYQTFKDAIRSFTANGWKEIRAAGKQVLMGGVGGRYGKHAKALIEAIHDAPANAPQLTRREDWGSVAQRAGTTTGKLADFFTSKIGTDYAFTQDLVSTQYQDHWSGSLKWVIEKGSKAVFAEPYSSNAHEREWITAGQFRILKVEQEGGTLVVYVRQVGTFDLPD